VRQQQSEALGVLQQGHSQAAGLPSGLPSWTRRMRLIYLM